MLRIYLLLMLILTFGHGFGQKKKKKGQQEQTTTEHKEDNKFNSGTFSGLSFRSVGPAITSGRISDFAVNPQNFSEYYIATASGGVWKTINHGVTYQPIFDSQGSYSIGCITLDPNNPHTVWVGTGENNGQRSVGYGDGVYRSTDGGKSWKHMGLKQSEHIGGILVDPRNSNVVFVASHGPLWSDGGDRGLFKSTDGGETWKNVLNISKYTGVNEVLIDPRNPDIMYASSWQRRRHVWTFLGGGPESAIYKSTDGGESWVKSQKGLPAGDLGRIGMAISPINPDVLYAIAEASGGKGGFFRSTNRGASWEKQSSFSTSGNYYQEIICDPFDIDRVYAMDTWAQVTDNAGKSFKMLGERHKHVDNHAIWINPTDPNHYLVGCDGGIYESYDRAKTWDFKANLPITQFYKVAVGQEKPFYNIYGGTQDNFSLGGPSRTTNAAGIVNEDWFITNGGDGFESQADPVEPNIVYAQAQYGWLVRYDKKSGETINIQPQAGKGEPGLRWNWDAPLLISPHKHTRLYFAANKLFKSEDRGNSWTAISPDLSRQLDRNSFPIMDKVWSMDAVAKNRSTSIYGNIVAFDESPKKEGLLYVGTDDGLVQVSENTGGAWRKIESFPGIPNRTYVNMLLASQHDENTVFAAFNNHKNGDFKPYLLKSTDKGQSWTSIAANLPERGSVYAIAEDHIDPNLLFAGTEFGCFFSRDGGQQWIQLKSGLPTIAVRDLAIHKGENDLVLATFGRGFYVLDNYAPLRQVTEEVLEKDAHMFAIEDGLMFLPSLPLGLRGKSFQGESYFTTDNPPIAATFTYYLNEGLKTKKQLRQEKEKKLVKEGKAVAYPSFEDMRAEDEEEKPFLLFTVTDQTGEVITRLRTSASKGIKRLHWNFRYPSTTPVSLKKQGFDNPFSSPDQGHLVLPGSYQVSMGKVVNGDYTELVGPQSFTVVPLNNTTLPAEDRDALVAFQNKVQELRRGIRGASSMRGELVNKLKHIKKAIEQTPAAPLSLIGEAKSLEKQLADIRVKLSGNSSISRRQFETPPSISGRVESIVYGLFSSTAASTQTQKDAYAIAAEEFEPVMKELKTAVNSMKALEGKLEQYGAPYTPGRIPTWQRD
ncbi:MAG: glycosyl hydrolase [Bacteroidota bacterium]